MQGMLFATPAATRPLNLDRAAAFGLQSDWRPPDMGTLPSWRGATRVAIDTETNDQELRRLGCGVRRGAYMCGVSFAIEDGPKHYLPFRHQGGDNVPEAAAIGYLREQAAAFDGDIVGAHLAYDLDHLWQAGIEFPQVKRFRDVQIADPLIYELHDHYSLDAIAKRRNFAGKNEAMLTDAARVFGFASKEVKNHIWQYPGRFVGAYAEEDVALPLAILRKQEWEIEEPDALGRDLRKVYDIECKLLPILVRMRRRGVRVDLDRLDVVERWLMASEQEKLDLVRAQTGVLIPFGKVNTARDLQPALKAVGIPLGVTALGNPSVTNGYLEGIKHPVAEAIVWARTFDKIRTSFVDSIREHAIRHGDEWRVHCTFNQLRAAKDDRITDSEGDPQEAGARFGRLSCGDPNLQQQPGPNSNEPGMPLGAIWRSVFRPDGGALWTANDLKQQEPKWSFHFSALLEKAGVPGITGALATCQMLCDNPEMDSYEPLVISTRQARKKCKILWLARAYGQGDGTLCTNLGLPTRPKIWIRNSRRKAAFLDTPEGQAMIGQRGAITYDGAGPEGQAIIDAFDGSLPFLKKASRIAQERAAQMGYVCTIDGRRCHFAQTQDGDYVDTRTAFNRIIQGSGADQTKEIVIAVEEAGFPIQLQVHDEIDASVASPEVARAMGDVMRGAVPMLVPTTVDIEIGPSWGESIKVKVGDREVPYAWDLS